MTVVHTCRSKQTTHSVVTCVNTSLGLDVCDDGAAEGVDRLLSEGADGKASADFSDNFCNKIIRFKTERLYLLIAKFRKYLKPKK